MPSKRFKRLRRWLGLQGEYLVVFHQDSPGMRVLVLRNYWHSLFYKPLFSMVGERHHSESSYPGSAKQLVQLHENFESRRMLSNIHGW